MPLYINMFCKRARVYKWVVQKELGRPIHFFFLCKIHIKSFFENSNCKLLSLDNSANCSWACNGRCVIPESLIVYDFRIQLSFPESKSVGEY